MVVPVEEEEEVLPGGGGGQKENDKEDAEDEDYVPNPWDIRSRSRLSCKTTGREHHSLLRHHTLRHLRDLHLQGLLRGGTGLLQKTQCHQTGKRLRAGSGEHTRQEEEEQSGQRPGPGQHTEEAVGHAPGQDATVARSLHQDAGGGQLLHVSLRKGAVCHVSEETRRLHPPSTRKKVAKHCVGCIKTTNLPCTIISLDGRKYTKKIFVKKFEGPTGGDESQRSAAAAVNHVVVCVRVCL